MTLMFTTNGSGTVFGMAIGGTAVQTLYSFGAGAQPAGKLALVGQTLCGTTSGGGTDTNGQAFALDLNGNFLGDLHDFSGGGDGGLPLAGLTLTVADNPMSLWSVVTTLNVAAENVTNLVYAIAMDNYDALFVNGNLVDWTNHVGGAVWSPYRALTHLHAGENEIRVVIGGDFVTDYFTMAVKSTAGVGFTNNVFGTTYSGGSAGDGTIFEITPAGYETNLYSFTSTPDGVNPMGGVVVSGSTLYGVTRSGGSNGWGTIFSYNVGSTNDTILYNFGTVPNDGQNPQAGLLLVGNTLYGTTISGGANNYGMIFKIKTDGTGYADLHDFAGGTDGAQPQASLLLVSNVLYGTTSAGGASGGGTIFSIATNGSSYQVLYGFGGVSNDGRNPQARLTFGSNTLYGTTDDGGTNGYGTVFSFRLGGTQDAILYSFTGQPDGAHPQAGLLLAGNILYGTTYNGGLDGDGTVFSIGINGSGYTMLHSFAAFDGANPQADLIIQGDWLYGTTLNGGAYGDGNVFGLSPDGGFNDLYDFMNSPDGANPKGGLASP